MSLCLRFIRDALPKEGVNTLVMAFGYGYQFTRRPELADPRGLSKADVQAIAGRMQGVLQTTWCGFGPFARAYFGEPPAEPNVAAVEAAACFKALFRQIRQRKLN